MVFQNSLFDKFGGKRQNENCLKYNLLWLTEDSYFFLSLLCNFWMDCNDTILRGEKKVKNRTVPIFCKLIKLWSTTQCTLSQMCFSDSVHSFPQSGSRLRFYIPYNAALVSFARFQRLLPRISFWNRDFKVLLVIKNEKQRYLILFLKAHQKEQLWL